MLHHPENITNLDRQGTYRESVFADRRRVTEDSTIEDDRVAMAGTFRIHADTAFKRHTKAGAPSAQRRDHSDGPGGCMFAVVRFLEPIPGPAK